MVTATRIAKASARFLPALVGALVACGATPERPSDDGGVSSPDDTPAEVAIVQPGGRDAAGTPSDVAVVKPDGQGPTGAPLVSCSGDSSVLLWDAGYVCGTCGNDAYFAVVCRDGFLACPTSFTTSTGEVITVPAGVYVMGANDYQATTGQCAYVASAYLPEFSLADPYALTTNRDPALPLALREIPQGGPAPLAFSTLFANRAQGEAALRGLVTLTDMTKGVSVEYTIGDPLRDATTGLSTLALTPVPPLSANSWYRVTVSPGNTQSLVACLTLSPKTWTALTAPETTDFYTYSRPMVADMFIPDKGGKGYLQFDFTEPLVAADLAANPMAVVAVDGVDLSGCLMPYACAGGASAGPDSLRLDVAVLPASFTAVTLRVPHAIKSTSGGSILDGTVGNPHATIVGDWAVYTFNAVDMVLTDNNSVKRWYHAGM